MIAAEIMVPCLSTAANCRLDWVAISAMGGWVAASATFLAVLLPFRQFIREQAAKREAAVFEATLECEHFVLGLLDTNGWINKSIAIVKKNPTQATASGTFKLMPRFLTPLVYPLIPAERQLQELRSAVAFLRRTLVTLNDFPAIYEAGRLDAEQIDYYLKCLQSAKEAVKEAVSAMQPYVRQPIVGLFESQEIR